MTIYTLLMIIVPALIVFFTAFYFFKIYTDLEQKKIAIDLQQHAKATVLPLRLQAYERMTLFLERIQPENLLLRLNNPSYTAEQFKNVLMTSIRSEFEHNLSQQLYISGKGWALTKTAKEEVIKVINLAFGKLQPNASAAELANNIFEIVVTYDEFPTLTALNALKQEIRVLF